MATSEQYEVFALRYAERTDRSRAENFKLADDHDTQMPIDYFIWVVRNDKRTIVVDTGFGLEEARLRDRQLLQTPRQALARVGIEPDTLRSFERLEQLADSEDHIIPGHDPLVRALYRPPSGELQDWVCRLDKPPARSVKSLGFVP